MNTSQNKKRTYKHYLLSNSDISHVPRSTKFRWKKLKYIETENQSGTANEEISDDNENGFESDRNADDTDNDLESDQDATSVKNSSMEDSDAEEAALLLDSTNIAIGHNVDIEQWEFENTLSVLNSTNNSDDNNPESESNQQNFEEYNQQNFQNNDDEIMFHESGLTKRAVLFMVYGFTLRHKLSREASTDLFDLMKICANLEEDDNFKTTGYMISKKFDPPDEQLTYTYYCRECKSQLDEAMTEAKFENKSVICPNSECQFETEIALQNRDYFVSIDTRSQIQSILKRYEMDLKNVHPDFNEISDVNDGTLYKNVISENVGYLTYNFSTDGAPIFKSSKLSMWPLQLIINELPPDIRFKNLIFAGIWVGHGEPNVHLTNTIMKAFTQHANLLHNVGVTISSKSGMNITYKLLPLLCPCDSVARPILQNRVQFNGYWGCSWCYQKGEPVNKQIKYPLEQEVCLRTHESHMDDLEEVVNGEFSEKVRGVKGPSTLLLHLPYFDAVWSFPLDYMHGVILGRFHSFNWDDSIVLGVVKQLWDLFTTYSQKSKHTFYIGNPTNLRKINERLLKIKPPHEIHRLPRRLTDKSKWKASEWKSFLLFYSLPCLQGILKEPYLHHLILLAHSICILLQEKISQDELKEAERCIKLFVKKFQILYGKESMTFNVHTLLHITESVKRTGPLWATSTFPFESGIFRIKQQVKGPVGVAKQIAKKMVKINTFLGDAFDDPKLDETCKLYLRQLFLPKQLHFMKKLEDVTLLGSGSIVTAADAEFYFSFSERNSDSNPQNIYSYKRCFYKNILIHSIDYKKTKKTNDTVLELLTSEFVIVNKILLSNGKIYIFVKKLVTENVTFDAVTLTHMFKEVHCENELKVVSIECVKCKCIYVETEKQTYICTFPNIYEIQ